MFKLYMWKKSSLTKEAFAKARNFYFRAIKLKKQEYFITKFASHKSDITSTWRCINSLLGKVKSRECSLLKVRDNSISDPVQIADNFNNHFATAAAKLANVLPVSKSHFSDYLGAQCKESMFVWPTSPFEIDAIIKELKPKLSAGFDEIPSKLLKSSPNNVLVALSHIFNLSLNTGRFIDEFKMAKVFPVFKKGDPHVLNNYRPISLLSSMSKILEKIMYRRLNGFLNHHNFFYDFQFGFRKKYSTSDAIACMIDKITRAFDRKELTLAFFLDLSKAFDSINHSILLQKLNHFGIRGNALSWFDSYLNGRTQKVVLSGVVSSNTNKISMGLPQGSILGPLLFLIFVNDFHDSLSHSNAIMYADDTSLYINDKTKNLVKKGNEELARVDDWLVANKLTLNISKTNFILFRPPKCKEVQVNPIVSLRGKQIEKVSSTKFLGVYVDEHLSWKIHMKHLLNKLRCSLGAGCRVKPLLNQDTLLQLYHSLINSHLLYCVQNWCYGNKTFCQKLQRISNKFLRMTFGLGKKVNIEDTMIKHNLLNLEQMTVKALAIFMFKQNAGLNPPAFNNLFLTNSSKYNTRSKTQIIPRSYTTKLNQQSISFRGPSSWNSLPLCIKGKNQSVKTFAKNVTKYLICHFSNK